MMTIYAKLLDARSDLSFEKVHKSGLKYKVLDGDTVLEMVGEALTKRGILFIPSMVNADITYVEINDKMVQHALASIELMFIDTETGDTFSAMTHGSGQSYEGKALGIAQTYGIKYFFARMWLKGESDFDDEVPDEPAQTPRQPAQKPPQRAKSTPRSGSTPKPAKPAQNAVDDGKGNSPDPRDDGHRDDFPTIRQYWPQLDSATLQKSVPELTERGMNIGFVVYGKDEAIIKSLGYEDSAEVKRKLELDSTTEFQGKLEDLLNRVIAKSAVAA